MPLAWSGAQRASFTPHAGFIARAVAHPLLAPPAASETHTDRLDPPTRTARKAARRLLPALLLAILAIVANAPAASAAYVHDSYERTFIEYVNDYRQSRGLARYYIDSAYSYWANWRSDDMCSRRYFSHTIPRTSYPYWPGGGNMDRYWDYRKLWAGRGVTAFGEIIAYNTYSSGWLSTLFRQFRSSYVHNSMLLSANYKYDRIGVGIHTCNGRHHVTVLFIQK